MFPHRNGLEANHAGVDILTRYVFEQGPVKRPWQPEELFFNGAK